MYYRGTIKGTLKAGCDADVQIVGDTIYLSWHNPKDPQRVAFCIPAFVAWLYHNPFIVWESLGECAYFLSIMIYGIETANRVVEHYVGWGPASLISDIPENRRASYVESALKGEVIV